MDKVHIMAGEENFKKFRDNNTNVCIIELGCGIITPTVRHYDELLLETRSDVKREREQRVE